MSGPSSVSPGGEDATNAAEVISEAIEGAVPVAYSAFGEQCYRLMPDGGTARIAAAVVEALAAAGFQIVQLPEPTAMYVDYFGNAEYTAEFALKLYASALAGLPVGEEAEKK